MHRAHTLSKFFRKGFNFPNRARTGFSIAFVGGNTKDGEEPSEDPGNREREKDGETSRIPDMMKALGRLRDL